MFDVFSVAGSLLLTAAWLLFTVLLLAKCSQGCACACAGAGDRWPLIVGFSLGGLYLSYWSYTKFRTWDANEDANEQQSARLHLYCEHTKGGGIIILLVFI